MNDKLYLRRIGISREPLTVNLTTLALLQKQHLLHVPLENIDIYNKVPVSLNVDAFYRKIVLGKRGGYCYECNGLFYTLLVSLGFNVRMISCRVFQRNKLGPEFDHLALIVTLDAQEWLVDVGFGDFSIKPLPVAPDEVNIENVYDFKVSHFGLVDEVDYLCASKWNDSKGRFCPVYIFTTTGRALHDFEPMNHYHQTSPESHFTKSLICSLPTEQGRVSLINNRLIIAQSGQKEDRLLYGPQAIQHALGTYFGISNASLVFALENR